MIRAPLKEWIKKTPAELMALVIIVCADLFFIYKTIPLLDFHSESVGPFFVFAISQLVVVIALTKIFWVSFHRWRKENNEDGNYHKEQRLEKERKKLESEIVLANQVYFRNHVY